MEQRFRTLSILFFSAFFLLLAGCAATVPLMPENLDAAAKQFSPPTDKANIYLTRTSSLGFAVLFTIHKDGKLAGSIASDTFLLFEVEPGRHDIAVITPESQDVQTIHAKSGENYFIDVIPKWGWMHARAALKRLAQEEGEAAVKNSARARPLVTNQ